MIIKYNNFSDGVHNFRFSEPVRNLGFNEAFFGTVDVEVKMDKSPHQIVLDCNLKVAAKFDCDRCTQEFEKTLSSYFQLTYILSKNPEKTDDFNLKILSLDHDKIDITKDVIEYAELAVPLKKLCFEECQGLCIKCGKNLNVEKCSCDTSVVNDIWAPLQSLKEKLNNK